MKHVSNVISHDDDLLLFRVALLMPNGTIAVRDWTWGEVRRSSENPDFNAAAEWLIDAVKFVDRGEPITFAGEVPEGREDDAWGLIGVGL